jgi:hypothetical protein
MEDPPKTARQRSAADVWDKIFLGTVEDEVEQLTPEQVDAELRGLGIDPADFTPAKILARVRARILMMPRAARAVVVPGDWVLGGEAKPVTERVKRLLAIENEIERERFAGLASLTPEQVVERARKAGIPLEAFDVDKLLAHARRRAGLEEGDAPPEGSSKRPPAALRLVKPRSDDEGSESKGD